MKTPSKQNPSDLLWVEKFARLLDSRFTFPGTRFRFGIEPIIGLIPGIGDGVSLILQLMLAFHLIKHGASGRLKALLFINVLADTLIGSIPVIGGIFDFFFKANERNLRLLKEHIYEGKYQGSGTIIWIALLLMVILTIAVLVYVMVLLIRWVISWF